MYKSNESRALELIEKLRKGDMVSHPGVAFHVKRALSTGSFSSLEKYIDDYPVFLALAERNIAISEYQEACNPFMPYPNPDEVRECMSGPLKVGYVNDFDDMFGIEYNTLSMPVIIMGRVGSGKSQLGKYMLCQTLRRPRDFNIIIPDLKREYRNLLPIAKNLKVLTGENIRINPLRVPEWLTPMENIILFSSIFVKENWLAGTSQNAVIEAVQYLYSKRGIFDGSKNYPTLKDLYHMISSRLNGQKSFRYRDILLWLQNRILPYILYDSFNCRTGIPLDTWRTENLVMEMDTGFTDMMYCFTISYLAGLRYTYNKKIGLTGSRLRTLFTVDEARILFNAHRDISSFGESYINEIMTKTREFGIGFMVSSQETSSFNQTIRSISYLKIAFPLNDATDLNFIRESFGLDDEQTAYIFKLPPYQSIVRYGGHEKPFVLASPYFKIKRELTDDEVEERMAGFYTELRKEMQEVETGLLLERETAMPPGASYLLFFLSKKPFTKVSEMTKLTGFKSPEDVNRALVWLEDENFIKRESYRTSKRGRKSNFAVLTDKAHNYLGIQGTKGKGGFEHSLYQHVIMRKLEAEGCKATVEGRMKGSNKACDVLAIGENGLAVSYEVTLHLDNLLDNIHNDICSGVSEVIIVTRDKSDLHKAKRMVEEDRDMDQLDQKILFKTIDHFFT